MWKRQENFPVPWLTYIQKKVQIQQLGIWEEYYLSVEGIQKG